MRALWWEVGAAIVLTSFTLSLAGWWTLLEYLDRRAARRPPPPRPPQHVASNDVRTRRVYPNRYRRP